MENSVGIEMVPLPEATFFLTILFNKRGPSHNALITFFLTILFNKRGPSHNALITFFLTILFNKRWPSHNALITFFLTILFNKRRPSLSTQPFPFPILQASWEWENISHKFLHHSTLADLTLDMLFLKLLKFSTTKNSKDKILWKKCIFLKYSGNFIFLDMESSNSFIN